MEILYAIPSYRRPEQLRDKTLAFLLKHLVPKERITVFVANQEEHAVYSAIDSEIKFVIGKEGLKEQRNFIFEYYPEDARVVSLDDDIEDVMQLTESSTLEPISNFQETVLFAFQECDKLKRNLWGLYPIKNAFFLSHNYSYDFKFIIGHLFGFVNKKMVLTLPLKEDYELSAYYTQRDGGVLRLNYLCAKTKMFAKGGLNKSKNERKKLNKEVVELLLDMFPHLFAHNPKREGEVRCMRVGSRKVISIL